MQEVCHAQKEFVSTVILNNLVALGSYIHNCFEKRNKNVKLIKRLITLRPLASPIIQSSFSCFIANCSHLCNDTCPYV